MHIFLFVLVLILAWIAVGVATTLLAQRLLPEWYYTSRKDLWESDEDTGVAITLTVIFWPIMLIAGTVTKLTNANRKSINSKVTFLKEMEKELANVRQEYENLKNKGM